MYNYEEAMKADIYDALKEGYVIEAAGITADQIISDVYEAAAKIEEELFCSDSVTGNASGSYTFNSWTAKEYVFDNADLLKEAYETFCTEPEQIADDFLSGHFEAMDVTIRCYLLSSVCIDVMQEVKDALQDAEETEEDAEKVALLLKAA